MPSNFMKSEMENKDYASNTLAVKYSVITLVCAFGVGQMILWMFPDGAGIGPSILFILMNLIPMLTAGVLSIGYKEDRSVANFLKRVFWQREKSSAWFMAVLVPLIYYGVSLLLQNVSFTGNTFMLGL